VSVVCCDREVGRSGAVALTAAASAEVSVSERTADRRLAEVDFARRVEEPRWSLVEVAVRRPGVEGNVFAAEEDDGLAAGLVPTQGRVSG
jgi:predicted protein tyrosine phosphatase